MKRTIPLVIFVGLFSVALVACSSEPEPTATLAPTPTQAPPAGADAPPVIPAGADVDRKTAMLLGIDLHRQLWATRPSSNYKFGFQWNVGDYAYERANVEVRVNKSEVIGVGWADNAVKTDGTEPSGFVAPELPDKSSYYSINGLFKLIEEAIDNNPARVSLGFDSVFGFPTSVVIEFPPGSEHRDISFFAAQLVPISGPPE
ncbi:MAG: DUF6174 domain-containing protein [Dehalococcoidia bacterium]|jgi:hypothetical protein|nr:DUF6174 domain-containing protein [Dehalococcoidia bacterium]